jgi:hypothetical protein
MADTSIATGRRSWRTLLLLVALGLAGGIGLAGWGLSKSPAMRGWLFGEAAETSTKPVITFTPQGQQPAPAPTVPPMALPESADLAQRLADIEGRLARVEGATSSGRESARAEGLLIAFAARRALEKGMALGYVEGELSRQFGQSQPRAVAMIIAAARQPMTLDKLKAELERLTPQLAGTPQEEGIWEGIKRSISGLIIVREAGAPSPDPAEQVERARTMVASGQVGQALAEVARLPNRAVADAWIADARRYVEAQRALDLLEAAAILPDRTATTTPESGKPEARPEPQATQTF